MRILVVEDAKDMNRLIVKTLTKAGYNVDGCYDGEDAALHILGAEYDAILLDIMMPKMDGYALLRQMREQGDDTPVLFLTAKDTVADRVTGLDLGADDYVVKPFDFDELLARIRAITRKRAGVHKNQIQLADLIVDIQQRTASRGGQEIHLLPKRIFDLGIYDP